MIAGKYDRTPKDGAERCPICQADRTNLSGHLLRVHKISKKSKELQGCGTKAEKVKKVAEGPYARLDKVLSRFDLEHFYNLDGATVLEARDSRKKQTKKAPDRQDILDCRSNQDG